MHPDTTQRPFHDYQLIDVLKIWLHDKKKIALLTIASAVISAIVSLVIPEYFESRTILYPVSMTMADRNIIFGQQQGQAEFSYFGNKYDASRILQVANSSEVIDYIINKYDLKNHYRYKPNEKYLQTKVKEEFLENYHALKNDKDAIEITLMDTDKKLCADMVNDIAQKIDQIATLPVSEGKEKIIKMLEKELVVKRKMLEENTGNERENMVAEIKQLSEALTQYRVSNNDKFSSITILEKAYPAEKKKKPIRWLVVVLSTLGGLFFGLVLSIIQSQIKFIKSQL
jgi:uncharacterized protein involved in exopolysaccharide biosynthesis